MPQWEYCYVSHRGNEAGYVASYTARGVVMRPIQPEAPGGPEARARVISDLGVASRQVV
jgi:hypothetical protein